MANYNLDIGFDWDAAFIGTAAHDYYDDTIEISAYKPLQLGVVNADNRTSANYRFSVGETFRVRIFNLSDDQTLSLDSLVMVLTEGEGATEVPSTDVLDRALPSLDNPPSFGSSSPRSSRAFGFSGARYQSWVLDKYAFKDSNGGSRALELSVILGVKKGKRESQIFIVDPEMWIQP